MSESEKCPECGGEKWSTHSAGLGDIASVAAVCVSCGYVSTSTVDMSAAPTDSEGEG